MAQELVKAVAGMNKESEQIREMMQREMDNQEPWHKRAFRQIRVQYPRVAKLLTAYTTIRVLHYLSGGDGLMTRGEYFLFLKGEERLCALKDTMEIVGITVKLKADGTVYGEELEDESSAEEDEPSAEEDEPADE